MPAELCSRVTGRGYFSRFECLQEISDEPNAGSDFKQIKQRQEISDK
jgi:hypothetical protein